MTQNQLIKANEEKTLFLLMAVDKIRVEYGGYIWAYPTKFRDDNNVTYKIEYGWDVEFINGKCESNGGFGIKTYDEALEDAINFFNKNFYHNQE